MYQSTSSLKALLVQLVHRERLYQGVLVVYQVVQLVQCAGGLVYRLHGGKSPLREEEHG